MNLENNQMFILKEIENYKNHERRNSLDHDAKDISKNMRNWMIMYELHPQSKTLKERSDHELERDSLTESKFTGLSSSSAQYRCGHDDLNFNVNLLGAAKSHAKAFSLAERAFSGCPSTRKALYMAVVADCNYVQAFKGDVNAVKTSILEIWNIASGIYVKYFNIELGILELNVMSVCSSTSSDTPWNRACATGYNMDARLNDFSKWRGTQSADAGLWHLLTACSDGDVVGIAWLNQLCKVTAFQPSGSSDWVSGTGITTKIPNHFAVVAHEIGHNFGTLNKRTK